MARAALARGRFALIGSVIVLITVLVGLLSGLTKGLGEQSTSAITGLHTESLVFAGTSFDSSRVSTSLIDGATPIGIATVRGTGSGGSGAVTLIGVPPGSDVAPDADGVGPGRVVVSTAAGDLLGGQPRLDGESFQVVATRGEASCAHVPVVWASLADWQRLTHSSGHATVLALDEPVASVGALPPGHEARSVDDSLGAIGGYTSEHGSLLLIRGFLLVISALVVGAFFTVWTIQRKDDIAVLKALGAGTSTLVRDALGQAAVVLLVGVSIGSAVAAAIGALAARTVPLTLDLLTLLVPASLLALLGLLGAALAVRQVTSVDPLTALSGT